MSHPTGEEVVAALTALAAAQDLRRRAFDACRKWIRDGAAEGPDGLRGWSAEEIEPHFRSCALYFESGILEYPFVATRLDLCVRDDSGTYFRGLRPVGFYRLITRLDGSDEDDYFVLDTDELAGG
jgi:hypothetical protein